MNQNRRVIIILTVFGLLFILLLVVAILFFNKPAVKVSQIFDTGSHYHMVTNNNVVTFIDDNSNIRSYNENNQVKKFIGSVSIQYRPKLSETGEYITTTQPTTNPSTTIAALSTYSGNSLEGKSIVPYNYVKWSDSNNLIGLQPSKGVNPEQGGPFETTIYNGQLNIINAKNPNNPLSTSPATQVESIAFANQEKIILTSTQQDATIILKTVDLKSWQTTKQQTLQGLIEYNQAKNLLLYRETTSSNLVVLDNAAQQYTTKLQTSPFFAYPVGHNQICVLLESNGENKLVIYDYTNNNIVKQMTLPDYIFKPNQLITTNKSVYISTSSGMYLIENFLGVSK